MHSIIELKSLILIVVGEAATTAGVVSRFREEYQVEFVEHRFDDGGEDGLVEQVKNKVRNTLAAIRKRGAMAWIEDFFRLVSDTTTPSSRVGVVFVGNAISEDFLRNLDHWCLEQGLQSCWFIEGDKARATLGGSPIFGDLETLTRFPSVMKRLSQLRSGLYRDRLK